MIIILVIIIINVFTFINIVNKRSNYTYDGVEEFWNVPFIAQHGHVDKIHHVRSPAGDKHHENEKDGYGYPPLLPKHVITLHARVLLESVRVHDNLLEYPYIANAHEH